MKFKNLIKKYRKHFHMTQTELGVMIGVSKNTISLYENNLMIPSADIAYRLMLFFNCEFTDLFYYFDEE